MKTFRKIGNEILYLLTLVFALGPFMIYTYKSTLKDIDKSVADQQNPVFKKRLKILVFTIAALVISAINYALLWLVLWYFISPQP